MQKFEICDCTLQVGGEICNWQYGRDVIQAILRGLASTEIDYIELGFLRHTSYNQDNTIYNKIEDVFDIVISENAKKKYVLSIDIEDILENEIIPEKHPKNIMIRVRFGKEKIEDALRFCTVLREREYNISIVPLYCAEYTLLEFENLIKCYKKNEPEIIYIDNAFDVLDINDISLRIDIINKYSNVCTKIGYCGYRQKSELVKNIDIGFSNSCNRNVVIDTTIGEVRLAETREISNQIGKQFFDVEHLYYKYIRPLKQKYMQIDLIYYDSLIKQNCDLRYCHYFLDNFYLEVYEIREIINSIPYKERKKFSKEKADIYSKNYMQQKYGIAIIIPTANRFEAIDYWLYSAVDNLKQKGIDIIVYDSSDEDKTEAVVTNYIIEGYNNVMYKRYSGKYDDFSTDTKVLAAYKEYCNLYKYLWICQDGLIITVNDTFPKIINAIEKNVDMIICNAEFRDDNKIGNKSYFDAKKLFMEQAIQMTVLGASIIKSDLIKRILEEEPLVYNKNYGLWQTIAFFDYFADKEINVVSCVGDIFSYNPSGSQKSLWKTNTVKQWGELWYNYISNLPNYYDEYKKDVLKIKMFDFHPFEIWELLEIRAIGGINLRNVIKNKYIFTKVSDTPLNTFYVVSIMPKKLAKVLIKNQQSLVAKILRIIYRIVIGL